MKTLAERMAYAMQIRGMTQGALSKATGIAQPTIWRLVNGKAKGSTKINEIARSLNVSPDWLSDGIGSMSLENERTYPDTNKDNSMVPGKVTAFKIVNELDENTGDVFYVPDSIANNNCKAYLLSRNTGVSEASSGTIVVVDSSLKFGDGDLILVDTASGKTVYKFVSGGSDGYLSVDDDRVPLLPLSSSVKVCGVVVFLFKDLRRSK